MSGTPRFGFRLKIFSHAPSLITINLDKTPLKELHSYSEIASVTNSSGSEVEFGFGIGCWEYDPPFPNDFCFEEFEPGVPYERMFWLDREDPKTSQGGELGDLEAGREYRVSVSENLAASFGRWMWGRKEELLAGGLKEKKERCEVGSGNERIVMDVSELFSFRTI